MNVETKANKLMWRINTMSNEDNDVNKEKRQDFLAKWQQASLKELWLYTYTRYGDLLTLTYSADQR